MHAPVGLLQLLVEPGQLVAVGAGLLQRRQQLLVLCGHLVQRGTGRRRGRGRARTAANRSGVSAGAEIGIRRDMRRPCAVRPVVDGHLVDQPPDLRRIGLSAVRRRRRRRRAGPATPPRTRTPRRRRRSASRSDSRSRPTSLSAVASRIWSCRSRPTAAATSRPRWRTTKTSGLGAQHHVQQRRGHPHRLPCDQHAGVVPAHTGVAQDRRRDHLRRRALQARDSRRTASGRPLRRSA